MASTGGKILVTGGAGFIGSHLVKRLADEGYDVTVLDILLRGNKLDPATLKKIRFIKGDVRDRKTVEKAAHGCQVIFHFAAILGVDIVADSPLETMDTEYLGMKNVADAAVLNKTEKILYSSTSGIYGHSALERAFTEEISVDPRTSYAIAKRFNEVYLKALFEEKGIPSVSIRLFNVYGPGQDTRMVIPRFIEQALNRQPLTVYGSGNQTRDFTYIDDTIDSIMALFRGATTCDVVNISNEEEVMIGDLAKLVIRLTGSPSQVQHMQVPEKRYDFEVERRVGHSGKLLSLTGTKPRTTLEEGLRKLLKNAYNVTPVP